MQQSTKESRRWMAPFFTIWTGQAFSLFGSSVAGFALVWWLTDTTGSATVLATATLISLLPQIVLGPLVGALVDRWNRRIVMIVADSFVALVSAWLAWLFWTGAMQPWHVYVVMLARSMGGTFHWPAMQASTSLMVPNKHLSRVGGINQALQGGMNIVAPPLGALLIAALPLYAIMAIDVVTAAMAVVPLFFVHIPQPAHRKEATGAPAAPTTVWQDLVAGLRYVWSWPGMRAVVLVCMVLNLVGNSTFSLMPILVTKHFGGQALELGWMNSAWGVGLVLGGILIGVWGGFKRRAYTSFGGVVAGGVAALVVGLTPAQAFGVALAAIFVGGVMNAISNGPLFAILQSAVDPGMQGRVFTVVISLCSLASPLGLAIAGPVADALGANIWFVVDGVVCIVMGAVALFIPAIVHLDDQRGEEPAAASPALALAVEAD